MQFKSLTPIAVFVAMVSSPVFGKDIKEIIVYRNTQTMYVIGMDNTFKSYSVTVGSQEFPTPLGTTRVVSKQENPWWIVPVSMRNRNPLLPARMPPGPDNPLGSYKIALEWDEILIHGTNDASSIGYKISNGCIRMKPEDIAEIFPDVKKNLPVTVLDVEEEFTSYGIPSQVLYSISYDAIPEVFPEIGSNVPFYEVGTYIPPYYVPWNPGYPNYPCCSNGNPPGNPDFPPTDTVPVNNSFFLLTMGLFGIILSRLNFSFRKS